ncbi:MAG: hypothetical protein QME64_04930 [bacterium]|nr:hypothetical protein [bacterium]
MKRKQKVVEKLVNYCLQKRLLLLFIVILLQGAMFTSVISLLWMTKVKEDIPALFIRFYPETKILICRINRLLEPTKLTPGTEITILFSRVGSHQIGKSWKGEIIINPSDEQKSLPSINSGQIAIKCLSSQPDLSSYLKNLPPETNQVTISFRTQRALHLIFQKSIRK